MVIYVSIWILEFLIIMLKCIGDFYKDCIESQITLGGMDILALLSLPIHKRGMCFHLFVSF